MENGKNAMIYTEEEARQSPKKNPKKKKKKGERKKKDGNKERKKKWVHFSGFEASKQSLQLGRGRCGSHSTSNLLLF